MACAQFEMLISVLQRATITIYMRHVGDIHNLLKCLGLLLLIQHQGIYSQSIGSDERAENRIYDVGSWPGFKSESVF